MLKGSIKFLFVGFMMFLSSILVGQNLESEGAHEGLDAVGLQGELSTRDKIKENIQHHLLDSHYFDVAHDEETHKYYGFPLPVILIDNGLHIFMSSAFKHGEKVAEVGGNYYRLYHNKIYKTNEAGDLEFDEHHHPLNEKPLDFSITKNVFVGFIACLILILLFRRVASSYRNKQIPSGIASFMEPLIVYVRDEIAVPSIGAKHYKRYMPFLLTLFFFIWLVNILGLTPFGINLTGNISVTFTLAVFTFLITLFSGNKVYWAHIFDPLGNTMPWIAKLPIYIILVPIEILGIFIKPFSLLIRLYANISAGHVVMMSLIGLIFIFKTWLGGSMSLVLAIAISFIEFFVALLQAYIFTMLSALYFGMAVEEHDDH